MASKYPEHEKLAKIRDASQAVGEFLHNMPDGLVLARWENHHPRGDSFLVLNHKRIAAILADYFGINEDALDMEKEAMFAELLMVETPDTTK